MASPPSLIGFKVLFSAYFVFTIIRMYITWMYVSLSDVTCVACIRIRSLISAGIYAHILGLSASVFDVCV